MSSQQPLDPIKFEERVIPTERRGNPRRPFTAVFTIRFSENTVLGSSKDVSPNGAYFVTNDDVEVEVQFEIDGKETRVPGRIIRLEEVARGSKGVAVEFRRPVELEA